MDKPGLKDKDSDAIHELKSSGVRALFLLANELGIPQDAD